MSQTNPQNTPQNGSPNDWWKDLLVYLSEAQAALWTKSLNFLFRNRAEPQILSAIIHSLGILALVLHRIAAELSQIRELLGRASDRCAMQNELQHDNTEALNETKAHLERIHDELQDICSKIQKATVPWLKIAGIAALSGCIVAVALINADHLQFLRVPDSQDSLISQLRGDNQKHAEELIQLQDKFDRLQSAFNRGDEEAGNAIKLEYDRGYRQALDDVQRRQQGQ